MAMLRDPEKGCPWDVEQDFKSISQHTIEEAYEVVDAIDKGDMNELKEELGDLLLQVVFHCQMADEQGFFNFDDVAGAINNKLIERHPHVFGDAQINNAKEQEESWEKIKEQERINKSDSGEVSVLDGVAIALPAMVRSVKLQSRAAKVGFDWPHTDQIFDKIEEEIAELKQAIDEQSNIEEECGDLLFIITNMARKLNVSPEEALKKCNNKFEKRFHYIERELKNAGKTMDDASLEEMDRLWNKAKKN